MTMTDLLTKAVERKASDLHITVGSFPMVRKDGVLTPLQEEKMTPGMTQLLAKELMSKKGTDQLTSEGELDLSYSLAGIGRFRINIFLQRGSYGISCRIISSKIPSIDELGLIPLVKDLAREDKGLVIVTGATGSGKTTTLASMVEYINREKTSHIITLEDPIEYLHDHKKSIINQREIGSDCSGFAPGLRAALRQDPDVILVGEMRDLETIQTAITAAETGHLVLATLHTVDAPKTIDRIIDVFPPHQQNQVRIQLAGTLKGILAQRLLPRVGGNRVAAIEALVSTPGIKNLIREGKTHQIYSQMQMGAKYQMKTMESAIKELAQQGLISKKTMDEHLPANNILN
ncbi:type IV pilus twitching motility protein PilT [Natranaerobius trueperi]|uniref:Type IV pili twitching motility protein PilT n=1 Tax=Natranaerobius trueperi TaxID=759412 RepID=A0A226BYK2_9FIRM|nr:type IV pili twitching motility protein PilT [Natranaerobius trueperi]